MEPDPPSLPGPGYYDDPNDATVQRYWDGEKWTDNRIPKTQPGNEKSSDATGTVVVGYILAALMPLIGFIIGLTQINRNKHGIWIVVVSIVAFFVWVAIISAGADSGGNGYYR